MTALTGETGAGKTLRGGGHRAARRRAGRAVLVRPGAAEAWVEGRFERPDGDRGDPRPGGAGRGPEPGLRRRAHGPGRRPGRVGGRAWSTCTASTPTSPCSPRRCSAPPSTRFGGIDRAAARAGPSPAPRDRRRPSPRWAATSGPGPARSTCCASRSPSSRRPASTTPTRRTPSSGGGRPRRRRAPGRRPPRPAHQALDGDAAPARRSARRSRRCGAGQARRVPSPTSPTGSRPLAAEVADAATSCATLAEPIDRRPRAAGRRRRRGASSCASCAASTATPWPT